MKIIYDTNIFLDALRGKAFDEIFEVGQEIFISSENVPELKDDAKRLNIKVSSGKISVLETDEETLEKYVVLRRKYPSGPSFPDLVTLALIFSRGLDTLATADNPLRVAATGEKINPLWLGDLLNFLFANGKMTEAEAIEICETAYERGRPKFAKELWPFSSKAKVGTQP